MNLTLVIISGSIFMIGLCLFIILAAAWSRRKVSKYPRYQAPELSACEGGGSQFEDEFVGLMYNAVDASVAPGTYYDTPDYSSNSDSLSSDDGGCDGGGCDGGGD